MSPRVGGSRLRSEIERCLRLCVTRPLPEPGRERDLSCASAPRRLTGWQPETGAPTGLGQVATRDVTSGIVELRSQADSLAGRRRLPELGLEVEDWAENVYRIDEHDPLSAEVRCRRRAALGRRDWDVRVDADAHMRCTAEDFVVDTELRAFENGRLFATRRYTSRVPRRD
jgi:hypothetical protein